MEQNSQKELISTLRSLSIAVWVLVLIGLVNLGIYFYSSWGIYMSVEESAAIQLQSEEIKPASSESSTSNNSPNRVSFHELSPEESIDQSKVVFITKNVDDGENVACIITEILKRDLEYSFYYKPGDEYNFCSRYKKPNVYYGEGSVHFITERAGLESSISIQQERILGFNDMPLSQFRELVKQSQL